MNTNINKVKNEILRINKFLDAALKREKKACSIGCSHCCHQNIPVHAAEEITITEYVDKEFTLIDIKALTSRLREWFRFVNAHTPNVPTLSQYDVRVFGEQIIKHRIPCPFLVDDKCSVYPVRPITCRSFYVAEDPGKCAVNPGRLGEANGYRKQMLGIKDIARVADIMQLRLLPYAVAEHFGVMNEIKKGIASEVAMSLVERTP